MVDYFHLFKIKKNVNYSFLRIGGGEYQLYPTSWKLMRDGTKDALSIRNWIARNFEKNSFVGFYPQLVSINQWKRMEINT
ncbi:unnamed protein product [Rotaria sordida]|uniref:Uncharacterized protein n=1 Tax=Rotaria sordida TaxID=392033 RepID=A0A815KNJ0_9BILA|nr:unnamed protein product [Rotaria sordida]